MTENTKHELAACCGLSDPIPSAGLPALSKDHDGEEEKI